MGEVRRFVPGLTYVPSHPRGGPHPHIPHPTEQVPSDCRNRHSVTVRYKGTHNGWAIMAGATQMPSQGPGSSPVGATAGG